MECPKHIHLIENESDENGTPDDPKEKEAKAETKELEIYHAVEGESLMVIKETTSATEKKSLRNNFFRSKGTVNGQACIGVIDGGSCGNIISQAFVDRLQLKV